MDHEAAMHAGHRAQHLLTEITPHLDNLRAEYLAAWENTPTRDVEGREIIFRLVKTLDKFRNNILSVIDNGKLSEVEIRQLREGDKPSWL